MKAGDEMEAIDAATRYWRRFGNAVAYLVYFFLIMPSLIVIPMSFGTNREIVFPPTTLSLNLYREYFFESTWMAATVESLKVAFASSALSLGIGFLAAYAFVRSDFPGKSAARFVALSPMVVPTIIIALGSYLYFARLGLTGTTLGLVLAHTVHTTPFVIVTAMAGLQHVDPNLEKAATIMGAGRCTILRRVSIPLIMPALVAGGLFAFLISLDEVVIAWFLTGPTTQTLPVKMYSAIQWEISPVLAAISTLLTVLSLTVCLIAVSLQRVEFSHA